MKTIITITIAALAICASLIPKDAAASKVTGKRDNAVVTTVKAENKEFIDYLKKVGKKAFKKGVSIPTLYSALEGLEPIPKVIQYDKRQPEVIKTFAQYLTSVLPKSRKDKAHRKHQENQKLLKEIERKFGVQSRFIVALWGIESNFGRNMGSFPIIASLATLAYDGRRREFFEQELINALLMVEDHDIDPDEMVGSWAGAMGQSQFMPSSYLTFAVDYDGDKKADIWKTKPDVFASIANYLAKSGWDSNQTWGRKIKLPKDFDFKLADTKISKTLSEWQKLGIRRADGSDLPQAAIKASVINLEDGNRHKDNGHYYLVYDNFKVLLKWNRSLYFATVVGLLSDSIR